MKLFVTGTHTGIGKTITSAILTQALDADYWKPIQAGDLDNSDTMVVDELTERSNSILHPEAFRLNHPMSPHAAAERDGVQIEVSELKLPETSNHLIVEGAGGILVPVNDREFIIDIPIALGLEVILVSENYLGSINHTLLSIEALKSRNVKIKGMVFNGEPNPDTESIIQNFHPLPVLGHILREEKWNKNRVSHYASMIKENLTT